MNLTRRFGSGRGRLSLRSRLLAGLITVTALFLIIMGVVTTVVLGNSEQNQFNSDLSLTARIKLTEVANLHQRVRRGLHQPAHQEGGRAHLDLAGHGGAAGHDRRPAGQWGGETVLRPGGQPAADRYSASRCRVDPPLTAIWRAITPSEARH